MPLAENAGENPPLKPFYSDLLGRENFQVVRFEPRVPAPSRQLRAPRNSAVQKPGTQESGGAT